MKSFLVLAVAVAVVGITSANAAEGFLCEPVIGETDVYCTPDGIFQACVSRPIYADKISCKTVEWTIETGSRGRYDRAFTYSVPKGYRVIPGTAHEVIYGHGYYSTKCTIVGQSAVEVHYHVTGSGGPFGGGGYSVSHCEVDAEKIVKPARK